MFIGHWHIRKMIYHQNHIITLVLTLGTQAKNVKENTGGKPSDSCTISLSL